jgi:hypothetical protein
MTAGSPGPGGGAGTSPSPGPGLGGGAGPGPGGGAGPGPGGGAGPGAGPGLGGPDPGPLLRPYALTDGRTESSRADLAVEDLVRAVPAAARWPTRLSLEHRSIARLCREAQSVAEIAAHLDFPLGVARILVSDLADQGVVVVHRTPDREGQAGVALLEQVLQGLQRL